MSEIRIVRDYPHPPEKVWRAVTDPALIPLWTSTGAGGRPEGFVPVAGTKFRLVAKPKPGWNGIVDCEVLEVDESRLLRYSWADGNGGGDVTQVAYRLESRAARGPGRPRRRRHAPPGQHPLVRSWTGNAGTASRCLLAGLCLGA